MTAELPASAVLASLALVMAVNAAPIVARWVLGRRLASAVDAGARTRSARPWLGPTKTWRGIAAAVLSGATLAPLLGFSVATGVLTALLAMAGDLISSFLKRRLGIPPSGRALGLDQIPEALLPLAVLRERFGLPWTAVALEVCAFLLLALALSQVLFRLRLRKRPY